ncbi:MAG: cell division protein FtsZ [Candidatus Micrarchaeaceae archaeon]
MELLDNALNQAVNEQSVDPDLFRPRIAVCGIGGGGSNTINRISKMEIHGAKLIAINTDNKHLYSLDPSIKKLLIGGPLTRGLGAGGFPEIGKKAAEYSRSDISSELSDSNMVFITAGMGGGTGTGAAQVVAELAKSAGAIVVGIVTFPFALERVRMEVARKGIEELRKNVDTLIVIDNQRLVTLYPNLAIEQAFRVADEVTSRAIKGITETITTPSLINLDFADVKNIMAGGGLAMISVGEGKGTDKVNAVVKDTLSNKLLDVDYENASGVLLHITGGEDMTLGEANEIGSKLTSMVSPNANVLWGARIDPSYNGKVEVIAIFSGVSGSSILGHGDEGEGSGSLGIESI